MRWALRSYLREKKTNSAPVINDVYRDVREKYIPTDIEVLGTVLDSLQINQYIAYKGLSPEKISRSLNSIKFQKKKSGSSITKRHRLLIKKMVMNSPKRGQKLLGGSYAFNILFIVLAN